MIDPSGELFVDNTILRAVAECSTKALMRHHFDFTTPDESGPLHAGSCAHEALATFQRTGDRQQALDTFTRLYEDFAATVPEDDRLSLANLQTILGAWMAQNPVETLPWVVHPQLVEVGFVLPLDPHDQFQFCGRLDGLVEDRGRSAWYIQDWKTTGRVDAVATRRIQLDSQFSGYIWAAERHVKRPVVGAFVAFLEFSRLPSDPVRRCRDHRVPYAECGPQHIKSYVGITTRSPEQLEQWRKAARHLAERWRELVRRWPRLKDIHRVRQQGMFTRACDWCEFRDWCAAGRPVDRASQMFKRERWSPLDYALQATTEKQGGA